MIVVTMGAWQKNLRDWEGTAKELVATIGDVVGETIPASEFAPNIRLLRHYQGVGAISRPERRGKEAIYRYRHLLETMVVRHLVIDGWPLTKITTMTQGASDEELVQMLPDYGSQKTASRNRAQQLVGDFAKEAMQASATSSAGGASGRLGKPRKSSGATKRQTESFSLAEPTAAPRRREMLDVDVADWCRLTLDRSALGRLEKGDVEHLVENLRKAIEMERIRERRRRKK